MFFKLVALLVCLLVALAASSPLGYDYDIGKYYPEYRQPNYEKFPPVLARLPRSPGGSVDVGYHQDRYGKTGSVDYKQNVWTSSDGRGTVDAYAHAERNFDRNHNSYGGGIQGSWHF